jgi:hypothetical protein
MTKKFIAQLHGRIIIIVAIAVIFAWSPWITDEYATTAVVEFLDGPD